MSERELTLLKKVDELYLQYQFDQLSGTPVDRDLLKYCFTAMYPSVKAMRPLKSTDLFSEPLVGKSFSAYFHYPFCSGRCSFCHFNVITGQKVETTTAYHDSLIRELEIWSSLLHNCQTQNIYFGGGTPSLMPTNKIAELVETLYSFLPPIKGSMNTLEIHPEIIRDNAKNYLQEIQKIGINRISIGVQDFDSNILSTSDRRHSPKEAIRIIKQAQDLGLTINIDLLSPLPSQTLQSWPRTLKTAFGLDVDSITLYTTSIRKSMAIYPQYQSKQNFPTDAEIFKMQIMTQLFAAESGYEENFSRWFTKKKPNSFWQASFLTPRPSILGLGCGAYGNIESSHYYNFSRIPDYLEKLSNWELPTWRGMILSEREKIHREMVLSIRSGHVLMQKFKKEFDVEIQEFFQPQIQFLLDYKLVTMNSTLLSLTNKGKILSDEIAAMFASVEVRLRSNQDPTLKQDPNSYQLNHLNHFYEL